jgi:hypothetical protein
VRTRLLVGLAGTVADEGEHWRLYEEAAREDGNLLAAAGACLVLRHRDPGERGA